MYVIRDMINRRNVGGVYETLDAANADYERVMGRLANTAQNVNNIKIIRVGNNQGGEDVRTTDRKP